MALRPIGPNATLEDVIQVMNENLADIENRLNKFIVKDETGKHRIILGKDPNGQYVLAISEDDYDVIDVLTE